MVNEENDNHFNERLQKSATFFCKKYISITNKEGIRLLCLLESFKRQRLSLLLECR